MWTERTLGLVAVAVVTSLFSTGCPSLDLNGTYEYVDFPWSGWPRIEIVTPFPSPSLTGTYSVWVFGLEEHPISGTISNANVATFTIQSTDPPGRPCTCRGRDDGSSIFPGSGQTAGDGKADRIECTLLWGEPLSPPVSLWKRDS